MSDRPRAIPSNEQRDRGSPPKLLERVRATVRMKHYSRRTEQAYVDWIRRYVLFHQKKHLDVGPIEHLPRAHTPIRLPIVLSQQEVGRILRQVDGTMWIIVALLYGSGLRLQECLELRVKDIDVDRNQIVVRRGKGEKDRFTMVPAAVKERLSVHLGEVNQPHDRDLAAGCGRVVLPFALDRKYPNASIEWGWQFVFPASRICRNPQWGPPSRFHLHESVVQRAVAAAARRASVAKRVGPHTLRHYAASRTMPSDVRHQFCSGQPLLLENDMRLVTGSA